jgi:hypothetical protein
MIFATRLFHPHKILGKNEAVKLMLAKGEKNVSPNLCLWGKNTIKQHKWSLRKVWKVF